MRSWTWRALLWPLVVAMASSACRHDAGTEAPVTDLANPDAVADDDASHQSFRRPGTAHVAHIDFVSLSRDGAAAISRDTTGGVRLWTALDGTVEPLVVPARGASFASVERHEEGMTVFVVDASSGGKLFAVDELGRFEERATFPPFEPLYEGHVVPGGERVLLLGRDHVFRLVDRRGETLARLEDRRFRAEHLHLSSDAETAVAVIRKPHQAGRFKVELQRLKLENDRISRLGSPRLVDSGLAIEGHTSSLSPDAKRFAVLDEAQGSGWSIAVFDLEDPDAAPHRHIVDLATNPPPSLGFVSPVELLVSANDGSLSWLVDLEVKKTYVRVAPPQDFVAQGKTQVFGLDRQVAGLGTWLFVHDVNTLEHRFMGYDAVRAQTLALSPSGRHVAWGYQQGPVLVETTDESQSEGITLFGDNSRWAARLRFFDEEHLLVADSTGGLTLFHWPTRRVVDTAAVFGGVRSMEPAGDLGLLLVDTNTNLQRVYEVGVEGFGRSFSLSDRAHRSGLLAPRASDEPVIWTLDARNRLRHYRLEDLEGDLSREATQSRGELLPSGEAVPLAIDAVGRQYGVRWNGKSLEVFVKDAAGGRETARTRGGASMRDNVTQIVPSPRGDRFVVVTGSGQNVLVRAYDAQSLEELWSYSTGVPNTDLVWSSDGGLVGIAAMTGAVLLDAGSGKSLRRRCGAGFTVSAAPPANAFAVLDRPSLCE
jgi:hypothetical protein